MQGIITVVTIKRLAEMAGVSPSTVVNVLHGRTHIVKDATFRRVQKVIKEADYIPNMGGRLLKNRESRIIGVIITYSHRDEGNIVHDPFHSEIIGVLEQEIRARGYFMMLYTSVNAAESIHMAKSWQVDGLIVIGGFAEDFSLFIQKISIPTVFIDGYFFNDGLPYVNVGLEDRHGAFLITEYLIHKGHRRIAHLSVGDPTPPIGSGLERLMGYRDAMKQYKLPVSPSDYIPISYKFGERHEFYKKFAQKNLKKYSALFFFSDFYAVDAMAFFYDMGIRVPSDISICGFDNNIFAAQSRPRLSTVCQSVCDKAMHAVAQLFRLIKKEPLENRVIRLGVSVHHGDSVQDLS